MPLSQEAARILGALMEKETTTPEYYPLSLVALTAACNQRSSRNPVMDLTEDQVRAGIGELEELGLAGAARTEGRVVKFEHRIGEVYNLRRGESALLCVLLLRGPQTPGELRARTERMHGFAATDEVEGPLDLLAKREPPLARALPREPGAREIRYVQLLSATDSGTVPASLRSSASGVGGESDVSQLERELSELRARVSTLEEKLNGLLGS